jgi:DnaJ like chaperone protein
MWRNFWGKILGAFFGFSVAGPIGALFGIFIGNLFDKGLGLAQTATPFFMGGQTKKIFNHVTFAVMGHIAKSDGRISEREIEIAREVMKTIRLSSSEQREAINSFAQGKLPSFQLGLALTELRFACRQQPTLLKTFVEIQYNAVVSSGSNQVNIHKQRLLNTVFEQLGFIPMFRTYSYNQSQNQEGYSHSQYRPYQQQSRVDELALAYQTLDISEHSTAAEIKKAYRKKMSVHHPDKLIAKGLSEKEVKQATEKAQKIQAAYEKIRQVRGL